MLTKCKEVDHNYAYIYIYISLRAYSNCISENAHPHSYPFLIACGIFVVPILIGTRMIFMLV